MFIHIDRGEFSMRRKDSEGKQSNNNRTRHSRKRVALLFISVLLIVSMLVWPIMSFSSDNMDAEAAYEMTDEESNNAETDTKTLITGTEYSLAAQPADPADEDSAANVTEESAESTFAPDQLAYNSDQLADTEETAPSFSIVVSQDGQQIKKVDGSTVEIAGKSAKNNEWTISCDPEGCASIDSTSQQNVTLTAASAGTVELVHKYGKKKLNYSETFTVTISQQSAGGNISDEDSQAEPAAEGGLTVSVKDTGMKKKLSDYHVVVTIATGDYDGEANLLQAYHIYLADKDNKEVSADELKADGKNLNLQVTLTYDELPNWFSKAKEIKHYKNSTNRKEQFISGVKFDNSEKEITFNVHGFSDFVIMQNDSDSNSPDDGSADTAEQGSILSSLKDSSGNTVNVDPNAANSWQVVDQGYEGNAPENKTVYGTDSYQAVRVQKNVIPTGTENEFLVDLSIDTKLLMSQYLQYAEYQATTSNNYHGEPLGSVVDAMTGNEKVGVSGDPASGYPNSANFTIQDSSGNVIAENVKLYWSQANNVTFYLKTSAGKYILMGLTVRKGGSNTVRLSSEAEKYIYEDVMKLISLDGVSDTMGNHIEYLETVAGDYETPPTYDADTHTLRWIPVMKSNPQENTTKDGNTVTTWSLNVAELVYKVRLKVQDDGFNSCASNMQSEVGDDESYKVNENAVLSYKTSVGGETNEGKAEFQKPYVRGLLYDYQIKKVDQDEKALPGAKFSFNGQGNNKTVTYNLTGVSGDDGMVSWTHGVDSYKSTGTATSYPGVAWGTYTVKETAAPSGYKMDDIWKKGKDITLCYTTAKDSLTANGTHMVFKEGSDKFVTVKNTKIPEEAVKIIKVDADNNSKLLSGAVFSVVQKLGSDSSDENIGSWTSGSGGDSGKEIGVVYDGSLQYGTYTLTETEAPAGYNKLSGDVTVTVGDGSVTYQLPGGESPVTASLQEPDKEASADNPYVVYISNKTGSVLPYAGGTGTRLLISGGAAMTAIALLLYMIHRRRVY